MECKTVIHEDAAATKMPNCKAPLKLEQVDIIF